MTDTPAIAIAEPVEALRRAQQGKSYWKRVWERLRRDKVTLAMAAILIALLTMVIFAPWFTAHGLGAAPAEADRLSRSLARHRRGRPRSVVADGLRRTAVIARRRDAGLSCPVGRRISGNSRRLCRRPGQQRDHASRGRALRLPIDPAGDRDHRHPRRRAQEHDPGADHRLRAAARAHLGGGHDAGAASRLCRGGAGEMRILQYHILSNVLGPILVYATSLISIGIILAAGLSFLGLGVTPPNAEWGLMLNNLRQALWVDPVICALPGVMIFITSMCFNLLSDGLRQAMDVRL